MPKAKTPNVKKAPKPKPSSKELAAKAKAKKQEIANDERVKLIEDATSFIVVFKYGPFEQYTQETETFFQAEEQAKSMNKSDLGKFGKRAAIYAIDKKGVRDIVSYEL